MSGPLYSPNGNNKPTGEPLIVLRQVVKKYMSLGGNTVALKGIDLQVHKGEFLVVSGKSGSGKTTLVNMVAGLDNSTGGEIWVNGTPVHKLSTEKAASWRGQNVGVVFQTFELLPTLTILQNITLAMDFAGRYSIRQRRERGMTLLEQMEIAEHAHKLPSAISGGQQQRVAIARAMANDPPIIVADEPTGSLDSVTAGAVLCVFERLLDQGKTLLLVTHDQDVAVRGDRVVTLVDGKIVAGNVSWEAAYA
jgi:putative ABC transport system ATP-binding protein